MRLSILFCLLAFVPKLHAVFVMQDYEGVVFAAYTLDGVPIWREKDKQQIMFESNTATRTFTNADFIPQNISTTTISLVEQFFGCPLFEPGLTTQTRLKRAEVQQLVEKPAEKLVETQAKIDALDAKGPLTKAETAERASWVSKKDLLNEYIGKNP